MRHTQTAMLIRLRNIYQATWGKAWPHDDHYLMELWQEERAHHKFASGAINYPDARDDTLLRMRECHSM